MVDAFFSDGLERCRASVAGVLEGCNLLGLSGVVPVRPAAVQTASTAQWFLMFHLSF
jgi:hypothetical protein